MSMRKPLILSLFLALVAAGYRVGMSDIDGVQWEVAPDPDATYAPDNTGEPPEPPDPARR